MLFFVCQFRISTHTPLTGRDHTEFLNDLTMYISTHTPLTGRDLAFPADVEIDGFLLTRPLRDVTPDADDVAAMEEFLLTRPLRDVTYLLSPHCQGLRISTHTPLTGRDRYILYLCNGTFPHIGTDLFLLISFI